MPTSPNSPPLALFPSSYPHRSKPTMPSSGLWGAVYSSFWWAFPSLCRQENPFFICAFLKKPVLMPSPRPHIPQIQHAVPTFVLPTEWASCCESSTHGTLYPHPSLVPPHGVGASLMLTQRILRPTLQVIPALQTRTQGTESLGHRPQAPQAKT